MLALWNELFGGEPDDEPTVPSDGIRRSAWHGLRVGLLGGLGVGLLGWLVFGIDGGLAFAVGFGVTTALVFGLLHGGLAVIQHYLLRMVLQQARAAPWRYDRFLAAMTQRRLLHRSGGGYLFVHPLLRDYLADLDSR